MRVLLQWYILIGYIAIDNNQSKDGYETHTAKEYKYDHFTVYFDYFLVFCFYLMTRQL